MSRLFILFQGIGMPPSGWNTEGKFLQQLKKIGRVYTYENKIYNTAYYDKKNPDRKDYGADIDIDMDYLDIKEHIKMVYNDISKYDKLEWIPIGFSLGGHLALAFAEKYKSKCAACVLLDTSMRITPDFAKKRAEYTAKLAGKIIKTDKELNAIIDKIKTETNNQKYIGYMHDLWAYKCTYNTYKNLSGKKFPVPIYAFINILVDDQIIPELKIGKNEEVYKEIAYCKKDKNYHYILFVDVGHAVFRRKNETDIIIDVIENI